MIGSYVNNPEEAKEYLPRYRLLYGAIIFTFLVFVLRLWFLQVIEGNELREVSEKNRLKQNKIIAPRGLMLDRDGRVLVENLPGFEAVLIPQYVDDFETIAGNIAPLVGMDKEKLIQKIEKSRRQNGVFAQIRIKDNLSRDEVFRLKRVRLENPGLEIRESIVRSYPFKENGAHLYGYVGEISKKQLPLYNQMYKGQINFEQGDIIGKTGLEEILEKDVRGVDGINFLQVDVHGREASIQTPSIYGEKIKDQEPISGNNVVLTIDRDLQEAAYKSITTNQRIGAVVAMKADGEVLAFVNSPSFDPNEFSTVPSPATWNRIINDPFHPLRNKIIQDHFAPGSTFKPLVAVTALQEKVITETQKVQCPGSFSFGRRIYHDHYKPGFGLITIMDAIERSSNVFFYKLGMSLGVDTLYKYISLFGIGDKTGIELAREAKGLMPNSSWKKAYKGEEWQKGEDLSVAIGQGFVEVTPLQMAIAYNTIGLEGKVYRPFIVKKIVDQEGKTLREFQPKLVRDLQQTQPNGVHVDEHTFKVVKEAMWRVANGDHGTARAYKVPGVEMAGKTGTSQVMGFSADQIYANCMSRPIHMRHHGWFIAFAPADKPEITVAALAEHSCHGNTGAAPLVRDVMEAYFKKYHPEVIAAGQKNHGRKASATTETSEGE